MSRDDQEIRKGWIDIYIDDLYGIATTSVMTLEIPGWYIDRWTDIGTWNSP